MLGGEPLTNNASIRDYNGGIGCHVALVLEETLLLPRDMVELRGLRRNEVFLQTKRFLGMVRICLFTTFPFFLFDTTLILFFIFKKVVQSTFRLEEMYHSISQQLDEAKKLKDQAEKVRMQAEEDKVKAENERDEAE